MDDHQPQQSQEQKICYVVSDGREAFGTHDWGAQSSRARTLCDGRARAEVRGALFPAATAIAVRASSTMTPSRRSNGAVLLLILVGLGSSTLQA
jgi:hypothetical protein